MFTVILFYDRLYYLRNKLYGFKNTGFYLIDKKIFSNCNETSCRWLGSL